MIHAPETVLSSAVRIIEADVQVRPHEEET